MRRDGESRMREETEERESRMRKRRETVRVEGRGVILGEEREGQSEKRDKGETD